MKIHVRATQPGGQQPGNRVAAFLVGLIAAFSSVTAVSVEIETRPLYIGSDVPGNLALVPSVEYPTIISKAHIGDYSSDQKYSGYFDSEKCYLYHYESEESNRHFYPASSAVSHKCSSDKQWSGNYLNWAVTQTIDPFRKALTGGYRVRDTAAETWLEKARHDRNSLFPITTITDQAVKDSAPSAWSKLRVRIGGLGNQMWITNYENLDTASSANVIAYDPDKYGLNGTCVSYNGKDCSRQDWNAVFTLSVRVKVCDPSVGEVESNCKQYPNGNWKPEGLVQEYSSKLTYSIFGYLNESGNQRNGGVMRARQKFVGPSTHYPEVGTVANGNREWDTETGVQYRNPDPADATATGYGVADSGVINYLNKFGQMTAQSAKANDPVSELYYAAIRYFRGQGNLASYSSGIDYNKADGFPVITNWDDPIRYSCQVNAALGIGDVYTHADHDLPDADKKIAETYTQKIFDLEGINKSASADFSGRGNSAYIAGLAYFAHTSDLREDDAQKSNTAGSQSLSTYWVDVRENQFLEPKQSNQYWLATKYGGFRVPSGFDPLTANGLEETLWHATSDYLASGSNGGVVTSANSYPRPDNFYVASDADKMVESLRQAFENIIDNLRGSSGSLASNTGRLTEGTRIYQGQFVTGNNNEWGGELLAYSVNAGTGALTQSWAATTQFPLWGPTNETTGSNGAKARQIFYGANQAAFQGAVPGLTAEQVNYIRGDRSGEVANGGSLRNRLSVLGDIVNSQPTYVGAPNGNLYSRQSFSGSGTYAAFAANNASRTSVIYVGANDGMLHAFNADNGSELFSFIPSAALAKLIQSRYWEPGYEHEYTVDGYLTAADVYVGGAWKTILVGTMGRGGNGVFAIDVTRPGSPKLLWEADDARLGNSLGQPIIAQVADGDWRVLMGNGPNSSSGRAQLVMIGIADGGVTSIDTGVGDDNGLSGVNAWSSSGSGIVDTVYAGDLKGNLWKFTALTASGSRQLLFAAVTTKPITAAPLVAKNPSTLKTWVWFGTGRYLNSADMANTDQQTWYGLIDIGTQITGGLREVDLVWQGAFSETDSTIVRTLESYEQAGANGWYFDLPDTGERMIVPNYFQGLNLVGTTRIPNSSDVCSPNGTGFTMVIDPFTGGRTSSGTFDVNGDGLIDSDDEKDGHPVSGIGHDSGVGGSMTLGNYMYANLDDSTTEVTKIKSLAGEVSRVSWRELIRE